MKKLIATIGVVTSLGIGAFAISTVMPASAGSLDAAVSTKADCSARTTLKDVLDKLVADGTISQDQMDKIVAALKAAHEDNAANHPRRPRAGERVGAIAGAFDVAAGKIGVSVSDLKNAVKSGQSVAEVAKAHNVDPADVEKAIVDAATTKIDQAVSNGKLTEQRANALKARLPELAKKFVNHEGKGC